MSDPSASQSGWLDQPENIEKLWRGVVLICVALVLVDLIPYGKHGHYAFEELIGFHGAFGFVAFVFVVLAGTKMREFLMRDEAYYDDE